MPRHLAALVGAAAAVSASAAAAAAAASASSPIVLNGATAHHAYAGHGALSAGASSRLLWDYSEPYRTDILDFLFKPGFGANLHLLKVEIGGDCQSTDGAEPSHEHTPGDVSCTRGYEFWLLGEAKKRNPNIKTFALSWGVPHWIGNGSYFSPDNWHYQTQFLTCVKQTMGFDVDYVGLWNERYWGGEDYVIGLRQTLDAAGFTSTKIVIPDGGGPEAIVTAAAANATFRDSIDVVGLHYPCNHPCPTVESEIGKDYWASEDYSTVADWAGAGCWGRLLSQNYVRMNMTSTISWSLIWSVYPELPYYGNGLMYAYSPWSGNYMGGGPSPGVPNEGDILNGPIWTSAHTTQFVEVGWRYLHVPGGGSGMLPGGNGGSYVTLVPPNDLSGITIVVEKLEGKCLRCAGESTVGETVTFQTGGGLVGPGTVLQVWRSNQTVQFWRDADVTIAADSTFSVFAPADSILTLSTTTTASKGQPSAPIPAAAPFPLPYSDDFSSYAEDGMAKYFADQAGSFAVRSGRLTQVVPVDPGANAWVSDPDPVSLIGDGGMTDFAVSADVVFSAVPPPTPASGTTAPVVPRKTIDALFSRSGRRGEILDAIAADGAVSSSSSSSLSSSLSPSPSAPGDIPAVVVPCDVDSPFQRWVFNTPDTGYLSNTFSKAAAPLCLNVPGCDSTQPLIYYACVDSGGTCCGATCYKGLQFTISGPTQKMSLVSSLAPQLCATVTPSGGVALADCTGSTTNNTWMYNATTGQLQVLLGQPPAGGLCLSTPQQITTYTQVCGRITGYSGFVRASPTGYCLVLSDDGSWVARAGGTTLAKGVVPGGAGGFNSTTPHTLTLTMKGQAISGSVDATQLFSIPSDSTYSSGYAAVGSGFHAASFDNFALTAPA